jgi:hypothetical protein
MALRRAPARLVASIWARVASSRKLMRVHAHRFGSQYAGGCSAPSR